ncbi:MULTISPECIES: low molecular weight protein-tyrosine-phosphatase [Thiorhodovibrio]|jgi:protein-tyrosine phosphatase|uniref:low molecular weight protein-tyrosine-phosphatase n=1 Tax=Thiorhodovibrio TaxID=61593 RepID=UPI00191388A1|nr:MULTISPECIES: low molecular weight protein-tyrosine-phosphatase [Thiorhodovibrio]MBK5969871.1 phosphotyrosine protein phosphatase [Thiorhodovibrio winogradskyi]WPL12085.1 Low molecular weight protein-tyrosine-phosphatase YfkJ [Thiorhodovibrio litoralis]
MTDTTNNRADAVRVLFVCMGNICRSPTAQGVFRHLVRQAGLADRITIDSAGTHAYHVGEPPDARATQAAQLRGIELGDIRARRATVEDFHAFDYVLAMDRDNFRDLRELCPPGLTSRLRMFMDFAPNASVREVPDPYYGGPSGFDRVLDLVETAAAGLLEDIRRRL